MKGENRPQSDNQPSQNLALIIYIYIYISLWCDGSRDFTTQKQEVILTCAGAAHILMLNIKRILMLVADRKVKGGRTRYKKRRAVQNPDVHKRLSNPHMVNVAYIMTSPLAGSVKTFFSNRLHCFLFCFFLWTE